jgi:hypothetical protein
MKYNKGHKRFRHKGKDRVMMDFAIFAIAFNLLKTHRKAKNTPQNGQNPDNFVINPIFIIIVIRISIPNQFSEKTIRPNLKEVVAVCRS